MALLSKLLRGSLANLFDLTIRLLLLFVTTPMMIEHLGTEIYGVWLLALAIAGYLRLLDLGLSFSGTRFLGRAVGSDDFREFRSTMFELNRFFNRIALVTILISIGLYYTIPLFFEGKSISDWIRKLVLGFGILSALRFRFRIYEISLKSHVRYDTIGWASVARTFVQGVGTIVALLTDYDVLGLFAAHVVAELLYQAIVLVFARKLVLSQGSPSSNGRKTRIRELLRFSAASVTMQVGRTLRSGVDPMIIARLSGLDAVPVYNVGTRLLTVFSDLMNTAFGGTIFAVFSQIEGSGDLKKLNAKFLDGCRVSSALACTIGPALLIFGPPFIDRWVGPEFADAGKVLRILTPPTILWLMQFPVAGIFLSRAQHHQTAIATLLGGLLNLVLSVILAIFMGFFGVVWATCAELTLVYGIIIPILTSRLTGIPILTYIKTLLHGASIPLIIAVLFFLSFQSSISANYNQIALIGLLYLAIFGPIVWFCVLKNDERNAISELIKRPTR